tara:strand:+ start:703 stop:990 length:288 start_codon:yes stop_codon:yes gene_type:complete
MAEVIAVNGDELVLQVRVKLDGSMLNMEEAIQSAVNEVGSLATAEALKRFDTTGAPIQIGHVRMTTENVMRHLMALFNWSVTFIKPHLEEKPTVL